MSLLLAVTSGGAVNYTLTCSAGSYTYTGQTATFNRGYSLSCAAGAYVYTGKPATLTVSRNLSCAAGAYTYTGQDILLDLIRGIRDISGGKRRKRKPELPPEFRFPEPVVVSESKEEIIKEVKVEEQPKPRNPVFAEAMRRAQLGKEWKPLKDTPESVIEALNISSNVVKFPEIKKSNSILTVDEDDEEILFMYG